MVIAFPRELSKRDIPVVDAVQETEDVLGMSDGPRILALAWGDALDEGSLSGMPWNMREALSRAGCQVVPAVVGSLQKTTMTTAKRIARRSGVLRNLRTGMQGMYENLCSSRVGKTMERHAVESARLADEAVQRHAPDAVFGPCMSRPIGFMETHAPIVYASDATASLLFDTYEIYRRRGSGWRKASIAFETAALARADWIALASERTRQSAIEDHHADPLRVSVVPMGANVSIPMGETISIPAKAPTTEDLRLLLVAADPERKRLGFCLKVVKELRRRGWKATLHYVGPFRSACQDDAVKWEGELRLGDVEDRKIHRSLLRETHLGILPSQAEMFGIAPVESAAFGRPSVVSDVGGLPTVVQDGVTGRVVPTQGSEVIWSDAIEAMVSRPDRYAEFSGSAHRRHEKELNWDAWGRSVRGLIEEVI